MLEVLVARIARRLEPGFELRIQRRLASTFSKMASMTTSASATPSPVTSMRRRANRRRAAAGLLQPLLEKGLRRGRAPAESILGVRSCSVTVMPRKAAQAAISPPMTPAPMTCTCLNSAVRLAAQALEAILQQEHAHQIARGRRAHEFADGARLGFDSSRRRPRRSRCHRSTMA